MAKPDYRLCDVCGEKVTTESVFAATDRESDPSGNGYNTVGEYFDLCPVHMRMIVVTFLDSPHNRGVEDHDAGKRLIECVQLAKTNQGRQR